MDDALPRNPDVAIIVEAMRIAVAADERAKSAHHRLDRMNGSIDRLADNVHAVANGVNEIKKQLAGDDGEQRGRDQLLTPARAFFLAVVSSVLTAFIVQHI